MIGSKLVAAGAALALMATPTVTAAQAAAPTEVAPAAEAAEGSELRGGFLIPVAAIVLAIIVYFAFIDDNEPESP